MKPREFWIQNNAIKVEVGDEIRISIYQCTDTKPTTMPKPFIFVREVIPEREEAIEKMVEALEELGTHHPQCDCNCMDTFKISKVALDAWRKANS